MINIVPMGLALFGRAMSGWYEAKTAACDVSINKLFKKPTIEMLKFHKATKLSVYTYLHSMHLYGVLNRGSEHFTSKQYLIPPQKRAKLAERPRTTFK